MRIETCRAVFLCFIVLVFNSSIWPGTMGKIAGTVIDQQMAALLHEGHFSIYMQLNY